MSPLNVFTPLILVLYANAELQHHPRFPSTGAIADRQGSRPPFPETIDSQKDKMTSLPNNAQDHSQRQATVKQETGVPDLIKSALLSRAHNRNRQFAEGRSNEHKSSAGQVSPSEVMTSGLNFDGLSKPFGLVEKPKVPAMMHLEASGQLKKPVAVSPAHQPVRHTQYLDEHVSKAQTKVEFKSVSKESLQGEGHASSEHDTQSLASSSGEIAAANAELLRDTFMERNPSMLSSYFSNAGASEQKHMLPQSPNTLSGQSASEPLSASKREAESTMERYTNDYDADNSSNDMEEAPISVEQRSWRCSTPEHVLRGDDELPWTCRQRTAWRYLGEHIYPSRLYETVCEGRTCWYGHFNCTPITYTLHVLQVCLDGCQDQRVPYPLRSRWQWTDLNVTVGCQCVR